MPENKFKTYTIHILLFAVTVVTTTLSGAEWISGRTFVSAVNALNYNDFLKGFAFSIPFLGILTVHEFGHYFTAKYYRLKVSLPYYIPLWLGFIGFLSSIGTMGAFIQIRSRIKSRQEFFDVGLSGPLAGFILALGVLYYGFTHLPPPEYIFQIHPEYKEYGLDYANYVYNNTQGNFKMGTNLIFEFFKRFVVEDPALLPNDYEMMHYPYLLAGYLALFFTALNLIPIGQLDGGHILYGLIGYRNHKIASLSLFILFISYAGLGLFSPYDDTEYLLTYSPLYLGFLYIVFYKATKNKLNVLVIVVSIYALQFLVKYMLPDIQGYQGWLLFGFLLGRVLGIYHPPAVNNEPLDLKRQILGWIALLIFILSFSPNVFIFS